jgi:ribosome-associated protein
LEVVLIAQHFSGALRVAANEAKPRDRDHAAGVPRELTELVLSRLDEDQAQDVVSIDLTGKSDVADAMIIASGRSQRHVGAMADKLARDLKDAGFGTVQIEGMPACDWVLLDAGDVVVHIFRPEVRGFYNLERIWAPELFEGDAPQGGYTTPTDALEPVDAD